MYSIKGTTITLTRGDTLILKVDILRDGEPYTPAPGEYVRFALKRSLNLGGTDFEEAEPLILKEIPIDTMLLWLDPADTASLGFGVYNYDIEITMLDGTVDTFIAYAKFVITPEVH